MEVILRKFGFDLIATSATEDTSSSIVDRIYQGCIRLSVRFRPSKQKRRNASVVTPFSGWLRWSLSGLASRFTKTLLWLPSYFSTLVVTVGGEAFFAVANLWDDHFQDSTINISTRSNVRYDRCHDWNAKERNIGTKNSEVHLGDRVPYAYVGRTKNGSPKRCRFPC